MSQKKSIIFLTTPTSGTGTYWRMIERLATNAGFKCEKIVEKLSRERRLSEVSSWLPEEFGHVYLFNQPAYWVPRDLPVDFIFNFRDPRDLVCNQYSWIFSHPDPHKTEEQLKAMRDSVREKGIDQFVLEKNVSSSFVRLVDQMELCGSKKEERALYLSYAGLCLDFEEVFKKMVFFFENELSFEDFIFFSKNSVENLTENKSYVGNRWGGADIAPGRFLNDLHEDTITKISDRYSPLNKRLSCFEKFGYSDLHLLSEKDKYFSTLSEKYKDSIFGRVGRGQFVLLGKESNLFLRHDSNSVLNQTAGIYSYSTSSAYCTAMANLSRDVFIQKQYGANYFHCLIPNKETALSQSLPSTFYDWNVVDTPIERYKKMDMQKCWAPFFEPNVLTTLPSHGFSIKTSSHWDHQGALTYLKAFLDADVRLKKIKERLDALPLKDIELMHQGDLGLKLNIGKEPIKVPVPETPTARLVYWNQLLNEGSIRFFKNSGGSSKAFILHDTASICIMPFLVELFSEVVFLHTSNFDPSFFSEIDFAPDFVFFFQSERSFVLPVLNGFSFEGFIKKLELDQLGESDFSVEFFKEKIKN